jgi:hypothetical protein
MDVRIDRFAQRLDVPTIVVTEQPLVDTIMRQISSSYTFEIGPGEIVPVMVSHSTRVSVHGAPVWVTRSNDVEDYWLAPGRSLRLRRGERLWLSVEGQRRACVAFVAPLPPTAVFADLFQSLAEWWACRFGGWRTV